MSDLIIDIDASFEIYNGGPVEQDNLYFIHKIPDLIPDSIEISNGIFWGGDFKSVIELINAGKLNEKDINPRRYFYPSLNTLDFVNGNSCLISESLSSRILCLPLFMGLEFKVIDKIIFEINNLI